VTPGRSWSQRKHFAVAVPSWVIPAASVLSAAMVAVANAAVQRWRHRVDRLGASVDHFCSEINAAADLATEYWLIPPSPELRDPSASLRGFEAKLIGRQSRLQQLALALGAQNRRFPLVGAEALLPDLFDAMTGGDFQVGGRATSPDRAQMVQARAADLNGELRLALAQRLTPAPIRLTHRLFGR
jgi:hypothetical protein